MLPESRTFVLTEGDNTYTIYAEFRHPNISVTAAWTGGIIAMDLPDTATLGDIIDSIGEYTDTMGDIANREYLNRTEN